MLAMGGESILCPIVVSNLAQAKALSRRNDEPRTACRPFDLNRDGFVIGEGGALLIETEAHALVRGADVKAVLAGWGNTIDGPGCVRRTSATSTRTARPPCWVIGPKPSPGASAAHPELFHARSALRSGLCAQYGASR